MSQGRMLRPGARTAGALLLAALALLDLAWIVRDFGQAADVTDAWWMWSGLIFRAQDGIWASSFVEPTMLVLYTVCGVSAAVSSAARGILVSTGVLTILLRVPTLWNLNASWVKGGVSDALRNQVFTSVIAMLVAGVALIVLAVAGRRRVPPPADRGAGDGDGEESGDGDGDGEESGDGRDREGKRVGEGEGKGDSGGDEGAAASGGSRDEPPARPTRAGGVVAGVLLTAVAAVLLSWEIHSLARQGWELYSHHFTGDRALATLLAVPDSWYGCALVLVCLCAAVAALLRAPYSRPLGMTVCGPLLGLGLFRLSFAAKSGLLSGLGGLTARDQLWLSTAAFEVLVALGILMALAGRDGGTAAHARAGASDDARGGGHGDDRDDGRDEDRDEGPDGGRGGGRGDASAPRPLAPAAGTEGTATGGKGPAAT